MTTRTALGLAALLLVTACSTDSGDETTTPAECKVGTESCPCNDGQCDLAGDGSPMTCKESVCQKSGGCTPGELFCSCGDGCGAGGTCREGLCLPANGLVVTLESQEVRSCDLLLETTDRAIDQVLLAPGTLGVPITEGKRTAISFGRQGDTPFSGAALTLALAGDEAAVAAAVTTRSVKCFDRDGKAVAAPGLALK